MKELNEMLHWAEKGQLNPLSADTIKWSNTLNLCKLPTNCLSMSEHLLGLTLKGLRFLLFVISTLNV